jgi:MFS family permease
MSDQPKSPLKEIAQPFIDLIHAPRALWGVNLAYLIEGMVYFGMLNYLHMFFNEYVHLNDVYANMMVGVLTAGITLGMFCLGFVADKWGVRFALMLAFTLLFTGRAVVALGPAIGLPSDGLGSALHICAMAGIVIIVIGYGMYQPGAYAAVRQFTTAKTASMGFAMLYALMNLGIVLTAPFGLVRNAIGISGAYWVFVCLTLLSLVLTATILSRRTVQAAIASAKAEREAEKQAKIGNASDQGSSTEGSTKAVGSAGSPETAESAGAAGRRALPTSAWLLVVAAVACGFLLSPPWRYYLWGAAAVLAAAFVFYRITRSYGVPLHLWLSIFVAVECVAFIPRPFWRHLVWGLIAAVFVLVGLIPRWRRAVLRWLAEHPLADGKFYYFIFCLIPVQTLFAHQWLTMPMYIERAYAEGWPWISRYFELALASNPLLVFIFVPIITALSYKRKVYNMMVLGTFVMAAPTFLLAIGPSPWTLGPYIIIMTLGESMWQPRFLQYAAEIAPEGRTGIYMGVAQFPWFLTKMIVPLYGGWFLQTYCPREGEINTETMWLIYALIAMSSTVLLILAKRWVGKDFKSKADD